MPESVYKPKHCAFHPKELIFNFCKKTECLLPLCPTCVDVHAEEHKQQKTYGKFENMHQVVNDIAGDFEFSFKELDGFSEEIKDQISQKKTDEVEVRRRVTEAKQKVLGLVERFFIDFEKEVNKSLLEFNVSMNDSYKQLNAQISSLKTELKTKTESLATEKVLKTVIAYHSKDEHKKIGGDLQRIRQSLNLFDHKRATLAIETTSIQKMVNELSQYMFISFQNWEQDIKYIADFIKTGFTNHSNTSEIQND